MHCIKILLEVLRCCSGTLVWKWLRVKHVAVIVVATTTTQKSNKEPSLWSLNTFIVTAAAIHLSILLSSKSEVELRDWLPLWPEIRAPCNLILFQFQMEFWGGVQELTKKQSMNNFVQSSPKQFHVSAAKRTLLVYGSRSRAKQSRGDPLNIYSASFFFNY